MADHVVVDASLAIKWLVIEEYTPEADALVNYWNEQSIQMVAVHLMPMEVTNALYRRVRQGELTLESARLHLATLMNAGVQLRDARGFHTRALELAALLRQGAVYDSHYLALAESLGCELWTADQRFQGVASSAGHSVHWVGDFVTPGAP